MGPTLEMMQTKVAIDFKDKNFAVTKLTAKTTKIISLENLEVHSILLLIIIY